MKCHYFYALLTSTIESVLEKNIFKSYTDYYHPCYLGTKKLLKFIRSSTIYKIYFNTDSKEWLGLP